MVLHLEILEVINQVSIEIYGSKSHVYELQIVAEHNLDEKVSHSLRINIISFHVSDLIEIVSNLSEEEGLEEPDCQFR